MGYRVLIGDSRETLAQLPDKSVHCCVTSPPYYGLRDYDAQGQIGLEETPAEYVAQLVAVFAEVHRVLRDDGTLWLNLGDSWSTGSKWGGSTGGKAAAHLHGKAGGGGRNKQRHGIADKQLLGIPWRVAFALQDFGWYLRQEIIWHKPNPMPESVKDRCTKAHEHLFLLSKSPRYHFDHEAIKEPAVGGHSARASSFDREGNAVASHVLPGQSAAQHRPRPSVKRGGFNGKTEAMAATGQNAFRAVVETRNKRSVWTVSTKPYSEAHFATYPPELIEPCVLAGCPVGGTVLDPFGGSGTTAGVALRHQRNAILCELNADYARKFIPDRVAKISGASEFL